MSWPLWEAFHHEWDQRPPVHWLVAWFVGYKPPVEQTGRQSKPEYMTREAAMDWFAKTGGVIEGVRKI
jgi:hypothetical protein